MLIHQRTMLLYSIFNFNTLQASKYTNYSTLVYTNYKLQTPRGQSACSVQMLMPNALIRHNMQRWWLHWLCRRYLPTVYLP